jgi:ribonuclease R
MKAKIGQKFFGVVSSVVRWGVYVELPNMAEGLVHVSKLNEDYFNFNEESGTMVGRLGGKEIRVGDTMEVVVSGVDLERRLIDFTPAP